jgi:hypothetical protein
MNLSVCECGHNEGPEHDACGCKKFVARDIELKPGTPAYAVAAAQLAMIDAKDRGDQAGEAQALERWQFTHAFVYGEGIPMPSKSQLDRVGALLDAIRRGDSPEKCRDAAHYATLCTLSPNHKGHCERHSEGQ